MAKQYWVEWEGPAGWIKHIGSHGNKSYAEGFLAALDGLYPHPKYRLVCDGEAIREVSPRSGVHLN